MNRSPLIITLAVFAGVVLLCGLVAGTAVFLRKQKEEAIERSKISILIAKTSMPAGSEITLDWLSQSAIFPNQADPDVVLASQVTELLGQRIALPKSAGQPMRWSDMGGGSAPASTGAGS